MGQPPFDKSRLIDFGNALDAAGGNTRLAAEAHGITHSTARRWAAMIRRNEEKLLETEAATIGFPSDDVNHYWVKTEAGSYHVKRDSEASYADMRDAIISEMDAHAPNYTAPKYAGGDHLMVIDPADIHIGKLSATAETGFEYNSQIAVDRLSAGIDALLAKAMPHGISKILLVIGNDVLHIDNPRNTTTAGTGQDVDGLWWQMFAAGKMAYVTMIERLATVAPVHIVFCPSNHDWVSGHFLADTLASWFRSHAGVSFGDNNRSISIIHRKYAVFGGALLGFTHGDGAKEKDLPNLMQQEARDAWGKTRYAYWYLHHIHHKDRKASGLQSQKLEKDHIGVTVLQSGKAFDPSQNVYVEYVRSQSPADGWHHRNGYVNTLCVEAFLHDATGWQCARFSHAF